MGVNASQQLNPEVRKLQLSVEQVRTLRERFELISDSFGLNKQETQMLYKAKPDQLELIFSLFDRHGHEKIDAYEFIAGMIIIADGYLEQKADILFDLYDFDHSKNISYDELVIMLRTGMNALCYMTGSVPLTMQELEAHTSRIFTKIDANQDNSISMAEWLLFISQDAEVIQILQDLRLTKAEDAKTNFGSQEEPGLDPDLETELSGRGMERSAVQERVKQGVEYLDGSQFLLESVGEGDQFMAVKPWQGVVDNSKPTGYRYRKGDDDPPDASLELEYVHGYRCHDVRNNLRYTNAGKVVYHTAAVGITLDPATNTQQHFLAHTDDIISFDTSPRGDFAVTGEVGRTPLLCVWNTETMESLCTFKGLLKKGVQAAAFSPDGTKVAAMGADEEHVVVIYSLDRARDKPGPMQGVYASGKAGRDSFLDLKFSPASSDRLYACGVKVFTVLSVANGTITARKGTGWGKTPLTQLQALITIGFVGSGPVTGAFNGCIIKWNENNMGKAQKVHDGAVVCLGSRSEGEGLVSGGNDGFVHVLDASLNKIRSVDLKTLGSAMPRPRSCCEAGGKLLIGTRGGEIFECTGQGGKALGRGHYDKELWGLAAHPSRAEYATAGQESMLALWDVPTRKQKAFTKLESSCMVVAYSPDGLILAAGLESGKLLLLESSTLNVQGQRHDRTKAISELKFSPDGRLLAVGAHDSEIHVYDMAANMKLQFKLRGHHSTTTHFDFSTNGDVLISNSTSYDILFHTLNNGKQNPGGASAYKDEKWHTWTCVLGWCVQGIWPSCSSGDDINALERSKSGRVIATVDDFGQVKLFKNPCVNKGAGFNVYRGHSSHVTNCCFLNGYLISTGGNDKAIFQWKYVEDQVENNLNPEAIEAVKEESNLFQFETVGEGDQFLAVKPWLGELQASAPQNYKAPKNQGTPPEENINLLKVHGYRSFDSRNNLRYTSSGKVVYPAAALGVVMDPRSRSQQFFSMHDDDVVCLAIHPNRRIVATGQMAHVGKSRSLELHVWDAESLEGIACLKGFHRRAIRHVGFSIDGSKLLSIGEDDDHSLAVYDWNSQILLCSSKVDKDAVLDARFISENEMAVHGAKFVKFFTINGKNISGSRGSMGNKPFEAQICGSPFNRNYITGTHAGNLMIWSGKSMTKSIKAHNGQVWSLCITGNKLLSGGSDGTVVSWDANLQQQQSFSIAEYSLCPGVRSIDIADDGTLLLGTRGAEILEVRNLRDVEVLSTGHFAGELWGLAMHPNHPMAATCGGDKTIRTWDLVQGCAVQAIKPLQHDMRALDWSPDGRHLVCGLVNAAILLLDANSLSSLHTLQSSFKGKDCWIEDIKFSPDGSRVAFGAHGGASKVEVMGVQNNKLVKQFAFNAGLTSALTHLDWSVDGSLLVVNSQAYELKFVSVDGKRGVASSSTKAVEWQTWTCVLGWPVQYIWPEFADGTDINSCMRSHNGKILASSDDFGKVNLFRWPVCVKKQASKSFTGHSSHVTKVKFSHNDGFAVSTGGNDKCVFVWQTDMAVPDTPIPDIESGPKVEDVPEVTPKRHEESREKTKQKVEAALENNDANSFFQFEELGEGDQFMAVKPWQGAIKPPTGFIKAPRDQDKAPAVKVQLEFVHGYRAKDCRNNLHYLPDGRIIYHAAGLGIVYDKSSHTQSFFDGHVDDIIAFALSPAGDLAASGEVGRRPNIFVWDTRSMVSVCNFKAPLEKGIASINFSPSGTKIAAVAMDSDHHLAIYDVKSGALVTSVKGDRETILSLAFLSETDFVTSGLKHFKIWTMGGTRLTGKRGEFGRNTNNMLLCLAVQGNAAYTGTAGGTVVRWQGSAGMQSPQIHERAVDSIWCSHTNIVTGGKDGVVHIMDYSYTKQQSISMKNPDYASVCAMVRSARLSDDNSRLLIGTYGSEIFEVDVQSMRGDCYIRGHYTPSRGRTVTNEVWGLAVMPDNMHYVSTSDDGTLRVWNIERRAQVNCTKFSDAEEIPNSAKARAIGIYPDGSMAAVGFKDGSFKVLETNTWTQRASKKDRKEEISDIKFARDGSRLAVGSHDNFVDIYSVPEFKQVAICRGHSSFITHLDWSVDSSCLHTNCGAYELLFWDSGTGKQLTSGSSSLKDEHWDSWTCVIGWPVQGIYPPYADGTDVNAVDRSKRKFGNDEYLLCATADDYGLLKLFRYPCLNKGAKAVVGRGHSSHVTNVRFSMDDKHIFTVGGDDQCVFQWIL